MNHENAPLTTLVAEILCTSATDDRVMINAVESLAALHGNKTYDEFFYALTGKRLGAQTAADCWGNIVSHISSVITPRYSHQGFLPSAMHYMQRVACVISDPRFLEADYIANIQRSSITDGLTGLYNQTFFKSSLSKLINQSRYHAETPFSVVMFDLDHFKEYNDSSGHLAGDHALKRIADIIIENLRESDIASRYGGEEFALLLPHTSRVLASSVAHRIRLDVEVEFFAGQEQLPSGNLTISGGIAEYPHDAADTEALIKFADTELYKAKVMRNSIYPAEKNRRKSPRLPLRTLVEFSSGTDNKLRSGISLDVSEFGMAVGCDNLISIGSTVNLRLTRPFWNNDCQMQGTVRQASKYGELVYLGIEFGQPVFGLDTGPLSPLDQHHHRK
jgi:diguanylate cyclase (GGDEF)-like protein